MSALTGTPPSVPVVSIRAVVSDFCLTANVALFGLPVGCGGPAFPQIDLALAGPDKSTDPTGVRRQIKDWLNSNYPTAGYDGTPMYDSLVAAHGTLQMWPEQGKRVALVGHFPFIPWLRKRVDQLSVLELQPQADEFPAASATEIIPQADVLALTGTTLINGTLVDLMKLRKPDTVVLVLGPSTPLSPILFDHGVHLLSGSLVEDVEKVLLAVSQGANFRQVHRAGVRLVTMKK